MMQQRQEERCVDATRVPAAPTVLLPTQEVSSGFLPACARESFFVPFSAISAPKADLTPDLECMRGMIGRGARGEGRT